MEKLRVVIVDDENDAIEVLSGLLMDSGHVSRVHPVKESHRVESTILKVKPDALFLDIEMPGIDGLTVLENIREYNQELPVVYVTAYEKYIPEAIKLNVYSYLLKPVDRAELSVLLTRLREKVLGGEESSGQKKFKLPVKDGYVFLETDEIFLLEAEGNYTRIRTVNQKEYLSSYNMGRLVERIPGDSFLRINRKNFLNSKYLVHINKKELQCTARNDGQEIRLDISRSFLTSFNKEGF